MVTALERGLKDVSCEQWNALAGSGNPFLRHEFLSALEDNGCVGPGTGWQPTHLLSTDDHGALKGAMPLYWKTHSFGEFVFDWAWADAYEQAGLRYYPKLLSAVPFTPVPGSRLLLTDDEPSKAAAELVNGAIALARRRNASSVHWLFPSPDQTQWLQNHDLKPRHGYQFHWHNPGYRDFNDFLDCLTSKRRKAIKRERRTVRESGIDIEILNGHTATEFHWSRFFQFYELIFERKWGFPSLSLDFFLDLSQRMPENIVLVMARLGRRYIAGALNLTGDEALFGRHWGCREYVPGLHFETCYYQAIEYCIANRYRRFEAGAQGEHKLSRGFLPVRTHSMHWIRHPGFGRAITEFLEAETPHINRSIETLAEHSPFKSPPSGNMKG